MSLQSTPSVRPTLPALTPLLVRFGRLGDMVLQSPLLHLLHQRYGRPCQLLTSGHWSGALFAASEDVEAIWQLQHRHRPLLLSPERWRLIAQLRHHRGPVYVSEDMPRQVMKIRRLLALAGIAPERCVFLTDSPAQDPHWVDRLLRFGALTPRAWGSDDYPAPMTAQWRAPRLQLDPADRADRDAWLLLRNLRDRPLVLLQPGNKRALKWGRQRSEDNKAWPTANWAALAQAIHGALPSACVVLCGSAAEAGMLAEIRSAAGVDGIEIAAADLPLRRLLSVMEIAHSMVAVDTGPAHLAAAVGCPLVVLYGAESPRTWSRRSPCGQPVIELGGTPNHHAVADIGLPEVVAAWKQLASDRMLSPRDYH